MLHCSNFVLLKFHRLGDATFNLDFRMLLLCLLQFNDIIGNLPSCFLNLRWGLSMFIFQDASCWGCNANSTPQLNFWQETVDEPQAVCAFYALKLIQTSPIGRTRMLRFKMRLTMLWAIFKSHLSWSALSSIILKIILHIFQKLCLKWWWFWSSLRHCDYIRYSFFNIQIN